MHYIVILLMFNLHVLYCIQLNSCYIGVLYCSRILYLNRCMSSIICIMFRCYALYVSYYMYCIVCNMRTQRCPSHRGGSMPSDLGCRPYDRMTDRDIISMASASGITNTSTRQSTCYSNCHRLHSRGPSKEKCKVHNNVGTLKFKENKKR